MAVFLIWHGIGTPKERLWNARYVYLKQKISHKKTVPHVKQAAQKPFFTG